GVTQGSDRPVTHAGSQEIGFGGEPDGRSERRIRHGGAAAIVRKNPMGSNGWGRKWVPAVLCTTLLVGACSGGGSKPATSKPAAPPRELRRTTGPFAVALTAGHPSAVTAAAVTFANGEPLDRKAIAAVEDRFPSFDRQGGGVPFNRPPETR